MKVDATGMENDLTSHSTAESAESLEYRVQRLEDAVAALQDTRMMEERVAERVGVRLSHQSSSHDAPSILIDAGRRLLPYTIDAVRSTAEPPIDEPPLENAPRSTWLPLEAYHEALAMVRMYLDPHYRMAWSARLIPLVMLVMIVTSWVWLPGTAILPGMLSAIYVKAVDLVLAFLLFKYLLREARRYLQFETNRYRPL